MRSVVRLLLDCDNACIFCGQDGGAADNAPEGDLAAARRSGDSVTFAGGEPTLNPAIVDRVAEARALGFRRIGIQTNGRRLGKDDLAARLARAGLTDVHLSIHGADSSVHDYHSAVKGSFVEALAAIAAARASGLGVAVTTVLTRSNFRVLSPLPRLLASRGVVAWLLAVPHVAGRAARAFDRVVPRLAVALPFALHAIDAAAAAGLAAWISGAPLCLLGPLASRALASAPRDYGPACEACDARSACPGIDAAYLARFGGDELSACAAPSSASASEVLASMFVGPGVLARIAIAREAPPAEARRRLPMLGKVQPALAEVPAGTEKKTGEALRAILPKLYGDKE